MRRYSVTYFIGQSFQGLWRNGVMSTASIMVLMSCLVAMGSFALLILNLNYNLSELGNFNEIMVFVDTGRSPDQAAAETETGDGASQEKPKADLSALPAIDGGSESGKSLVILLEKIKALGNFLDIAAAKGQAESLAAEIESARGAVEAVTDQTELANQRQYLELLNAKYGEVVARITALAAIELEIRTLDNVASTVFKSKSEGLEDMKSKFPSYEFLFEKFRENNGLPDSFIITYNDNSKVSSLKYVLEHLDGRITKVRCDSELAKDIENIKHGVILIFTWFLAILFLVSVFVIINTIKLAVFSRRQEISIMRYVGATNWFITLPFLFEGIIIGLVSSAAAYFVQYYIYLYAQGTVIDSTIFQFIAVINYDSLKYKIMAAFAAVGIVTGIIGSGFSLRKYLKA